MKRILNEDNRYIRAQKRVENLKGFYGNLGAYFFVIPLLYVINRLTVPGFQWFWFPMFFWGVGLVMHAFTIFGMPSIFGTKWEERKIEEILKEDERY